MTGGMASDRRGSLLWFFALAFGFSWLLHVPRLLSDNDLASLPAWTGWLSGLSMAGPLVAAFWLTSRASGRKGMKALWKRGWDCGFRKVWLLPILLLPAGLAGITILIVDLTGGEILWEHQPLPPALAGPVFVILFLTQALPEEYGWRGYALDRLQQRTNALAASLILGLIWGLWHLPLHFMDGTTQAAIPIHQFALKQMVGAVLFTWIYNNTNRSLLPAMLFHAVGNVFGGLVPYWVTNHGRWINFAVETATVLVIVVVFGARRLSRKCE